MKKFIFSILTYSTLQSIALASEGRAIPTLKTVSEVAVFFKNVTFSPAVDMDLFCTQINQATLSGQVVHVADILKIDLRGAVKVYLKEVKKSVAVFVSDELHQNIAFKVFNDFLDTLADSQRKEVPTQVLALRANLLKIILLQEMQYGNLSLVLLTKLILIANTDSEKSLLFGDVSGQHLTNYIDVISVIRSLFENVFKKGVDSRRKKLAENFIQKDSRLAKIDPQDLFCDAGVESINKRIRKYFDAVMEKMLLNIEGGHSLRHNVERIKLSESVRCDELSEIVQDKLGCTADDAESWFEEERRQSGSFLDLSQTVSDFQKNLPEIVWFYAHLNEAGHYDESAKRSLEDISDADIFQIGGRLSELRNQRALAVKKNKFIEQGDQSSLGESREPSPTTSVERALELFEAISTARQEDIRDRRVRRWEHAFLDPRVIKKFTLPGDDYQDIDRVEDVDRIIHAHLVSFPGLINLARDNHPLARPYFFSQTTTDKQGKSVTDFHFLVSTNAFGARSATRLVTIAIGDRGRVYHAGFSNLDRKGDLKDYLSDIKKGSAQFFSQNKETMKEHMALLEEYRASPLDQTAIGVYSVDDQDSQGALLYSFETKGKQVFFRILPYVR